MNILEGPGSLSLPEEINTMFNEGPEDVLPEFKVSTGRLRPPEHPGLAKFFYAFTKHFLFYCPIVSVLEIGVGGGASAVGFTKAMAGGGIMRCIDNNSYKTVNYPEDCKANILATGFNEGNLHMYEGDSKSILDNNFPPSDLTHIDGDHTYEGALYDIIMVINIMKLNDERGYIFVHDIDNTREWLIERTKEHPHPVYEAFMEAAEDYKLPWKILTNIGKHLGVLEI